MTITYNSDIATQRFLTFGKLFRIWRASIFKVIRFELLLFVLIYAAIDILYNCFLSGVSKTTYEEFVIYSRTHVEAIVTPLTFILAFIVTQIYRRWWSQILCVPWVEGFASIVTVDIIGHDDDVKLIRRTLVRYFNLAFVLVAAAISPAVKKRFPTIQHLMEAGLLTENEGMLLEDAQQKRQPGPYYWMILTWCTTLVRRAWQSKYIPSVYSYKHLIMELEKARSLCGNTLLYDWINFPLAYVQIMIIGMYIFYFFLMMSMRRISPDGMDVHWIYYPLFAVIVFMIFTSLKKVAETMINPYGDDDDDLELNVVIDTNLRIGFAIVDDMHAEHPELKKDIFWNMAPVLPGADPDAPAADGFAGSAAAYKVPSTELAWVFEEGGAEIPETTAALPRQCEHHRALEEELEEDGEANEKKKKKGGEEEEEEHPSLKGSFLENDGNPNFAPLLAFEFEKQQQRRQQQQPRAPSRTSAGDIAAAITVVRSASATKLKC